MAIRRMQPERSVAAKALSRRLASAPARALDTGPLAVKSIRQSLICLNPEKTWKVGYDGNLDVYDLYFTFPPRDRPHHRPRSSRRIRRGDGLSL
jgi:hypothetical protein